jgi:hypothetical protein
MLIGLDFARKVEVVKTLIAGRTLEQEFKAVDETTWTQIERVRRDWNNIVHRRLFVLDNGNLLAGASLYDGEESDYSIYSLQVLKASSSVAQQVSEVFQKTVDRLKEPQPIGVTAPKADAKGRLA